MTHLVRPNPAVGAFKKYKAEFITSLESAPLNDPDLLRALATALEKENKKGVVEEHPDARVDLLYAGAFRSIAAEALRRAADREEAAQKVVPKK